MVLEDSGCGYKRAAGGIFVMELCILTVAVET